MLSFRSIQTSCFRPGLTISPAASFSTSLARKNKPSDDYSRILGILHDEDKKKADEEDGSRFAASLKGMYLT